MSKYRVKVFGIVCLVLALFLTSPALAKDGADKAPRFEMVRDSYGIPHISAATVYDLYYGYGYAVATDRLFQMEAIKRSVQGTVAEAYGPGQFNPQTGTYQYIEFDKGVRANYTPNWIRQQLAALPKPDKDIFDGYAAGMNKRISEVMANKAMLLPKQFTEFGFEPTPWDGFDVIMVFIGTLMFRFSDSNSEIANAAYLEYLIGKHGAGNAWKIFDQTKWVIDPMSPTTVPATSSAAAKGISPSNGSSKYVPKGMIQVAKALEEQAITRQEVLAKLGLAGIGEIPTASNCWAVSPSRTVDGSTILQNGPQMGNFVPGWMYESELSGAGFHVIGAAPLAYPMMHFGHNGYYTFAGTAGPLDVVDMYEERLCGDNYSALYNGECLPMVKRTETINVKGQASVTIDVYRTVHGLVVQFDLAHGRAFAKKRSWEGYEVESTMAWIESTRAKNWQTWMKAAEKMSFSNNWYYADWKGNIAYVSVGKIPIRPANQDSRLPADGTGGMEWLGINPFYTNPYVLNPAQGWLTNWNNKPAPETINTDATLYASMDRVQVIMDKLESKDKFTKQEIWDIIRHSAMIDTRYNYFVPFMKEAVKNLPDGAPEKQAVQWISGWDGYRVDLNKDGKYDSPGQTIFDKWIVTMIANTFKDDLGDFFSRTGTPSVFVSAGEKILYHVLLGPQSSIPNNYDFLNGVDRYQAVRDALTQTIGALTAQFGTANMSQWLNADAPHVFSTLNFVNIPQASPTEQIELPVFMNRGTQNHMTVFTKGGVELFNVCPPGQNGFVAPDGTKGPHYDDQLGLYQNFQGKPMEFYYH